MDYKEKILAEIWEVLAGANKQKVDTLIVYNRIKKILATLPSEKEIAKGVIEGYVEAHPLKFAEHSLEGHNNRLFIEEINNWLDKELA